MSCGSGRLATSLSPAALARDFLHSTTIQDGDVTVAGLDDAEILQGDARGVDSATLQAEDLAEAVLGHVDACAARAV
jgi:hypothetical protein